MTNGTKCRKAKESQALRNPSKPFSIALVTNDESLPIPQSSTNVNYYYL